MNNTEIALLSYVTWFLILLIAIEIIRSYMVVKKGRAANTFLPDGSDVSPFMNRLSRSHANCYESFPFVGGILLFAIATGTTEITNSLALWLVGARLAQSGTHLMAGTPIFTQIRFMFFVAQIAIATYWVISYAT